MNRERLSEIWDKLLKGNRVLGWSHVDQNSKHILIPSTGGRTWEREAPDGKWESVEGARSSAL